MLHFRLAALVAVVAALMSLAGTGPGLTQDAGAPAGQGGQGGGWFEPLPGSGHQTLEDILRRQKEPLGALHLFPRPAPPELPAYVPPVSAPLGTLGGQSLSSEWTQLRGGDVLALAGPRLPAQAMTPTGEDWRYLREHYLRPWLGWVPVGMLGLIVLHRLIFGPIRVPGGMSGRRIPRFDVFHRIAHWFMATVFLFLGATGLLILLGRITLMPLFGKQVNSVVLTASMQGHNLFGPIFIFALLWVFLGFVRWNIPRLIDIEWAIKLGGLLGHARAGRFNLGEKGWFWLLVLFGAIISATGVLMLFPWLVSDLRWLQAATVLHVIAAVTLIAVALGHIYIGSIGSEGALEAMTTGEVDENWAKAHHDLWYAEVMAAREAKGDGGKA